MAPSGARPGRVFDDEGGKYGKAKPRGCMRGQSPLYRGTGNGTIIEPISMILEKCICLVFSLLQSFSVLTWSLAQRTFKVAGKHRLGGEVHLIHDLREGKR